MVSVFNSVLPIFAVIALGSVLKRLKITDDAFLCTSDKLIYYIFFPALLFWKIGKPAPGAAIEWGFVAAVLISVFAVFAISLCFVKIRGVPAYGVGSFSQGCYRFSTYIGMAIILTAMGEEGVRRFGVLIGFVIPFINVLAVSTLIWFSGEQYSSGQKAWFLLKAMVSNPLIIACVAGIFYSTFQTPFPAFVENTFSMMTLLTLPLALISIGGSLTFAKFKEHLNLSAVAAGFKLLLLPLVGYVVIQLFQVSAISFKVAMIYFALPTSPNNYILSAQLNSDVDLAAASIVLSTVLSIVSLSAVLVLFWG
jgi:malonate transporter